MRTLLFVALAACSTAAPSLTEADLQDWEPRLEDSLPLPESLTLSIEGRELGGVMEFDISGAAAFADVSLLRSDAPSDEGPCFAALGGECIDLAPPIRFHAITITDGGGHATVITRIPDIEDLRGREVCFQAVEMGDAGIGGSPSACITLGGPYTCEEICEWADPICGIDWDCVADCYDDLFDCPEEMQGILDCYGAMDAEDLVCDAREDSNIGREGCEEWHDAMTACGHDPF